MANRSPSTLDLAPRVTELVVRRHRSVGDRTEWITVDESEGGSVSLHLSVTTAVDLAHALIAAAA